MKRPILTLVALATATSAMIAAQKPVSAPKGGKQISDHLIGIFFEDISSSADGGLNAELIQNGSFEYNPMERDGWGPGTNWKMIRPGHALGNLEVKQQDPIHPNNPNYMRVYVERVRPFRDYSGWIGFGMQNDGFDGISVKKDADYDFSMFVRDVNKKGMKIRVALVQPQGWGKDPKLLADDTISIDSNNWKRYSCTLRPTEDCTNAALQFLALETGCV